MVGTTSVHVRLRRAEWRTVDIEGVAAAAAAQLRSLSQAEENGQSRIYLGIHWSFDKTVMRR
jgi:hypothetical protein